MFSPSSLPPRLLLPLFILPLSPPFFSSLLRLPFLYVRPRQVSFARLLAAASKNPAAGLCDVPEMIVRVSELDRARTLLTIILYIYMYRVVLPARTQRNGSKYQLVESLFGWYFSLSRCFAVLDENYYEFHIPKNSLICLKIILIELENSTQERLEKKCDPLVL